MAKPRDNTRQQVLGCSIFIIGLFKKMVVADSFGEYATPVFKMAAREQVVPFLDAV
ncbi:MAG: hypothetical protein GY779_14255 [Gammaproteobacteria bacterium]|nr:hypothetical protein [Gammaproteobacteria bacterium]